MNVVDQSGNGTLQHIGYGVDQVRPGRFRNQPVTIPCLQECRHRSIEVCNQAGNIVRTFSGQSHLLTRLFPSGGETETYIIASDLYSEMCESHLTSGHSLWRNTTTADVSSCEPYFLCC